VRRPDPSFLAPGLVASLVLELRRSMRRLLFDLCDELASRSPAAGRLLQLPVGYVHQVGRALRSEDYSNWKVVGWIEELNDLAYFLDVGKQLRRERDRPGFAASFLIACERQFYENSYLDELFPNRRPEPAKLPARVSALCARLARSVVRESSVLAPDVAAYGRSASTGTPNFERAELPGWTAVGLDGAGVRRGRMVLPEWIKRPGAGWPDGLSLGPTLIYRKDKTPVRVVPTPSGVAGRIRRALTAIEEAWPEGYRNLTLLTSRIIPLKAAGVVSYSYRHRPGLSFINVFDRDDLDLVDDLIHENSHHHLNLLLRKFRLLKGNHTEEIFYSPWRRSLRPIRGILHATFTFTMGAMLFERLAASQARGGGRGARGKASLTRQHILRARFRCLEEVESVRYSLQDLKYAGGRLGWLTDSGRRLVGQLEEAISAVERKIARHRKGVLRSQFGPALRRHIGELRKARVTYGPGRLSKA
jgi:hypothetical protein